MPGLQFRAGLSVLEVAMSGIDWPGSRVDFVAEIVMLQVVDQKMPANTDLGELADSEIQPRTHRSEAGRGSGT
jgi:hypothetical protein